MFDMEQQELPIPLITAWYTRRGAAEALGVSTRTLDRMRSRGTITAHAPHGGRDEEVPLLYFASDVYELAAARQKLAGNRTAK